MIQLPAAWILDVNRSRRYEWYGEYSQDGYDGLAARKPYARSVVPPINQDSIWGKLI
ncbi:MAG: hypothetical protein M1395_09955 [Bacteroidetes bacterium]|nr:hypothetical protein [Bacteroidota bacterium]